MEEELLHQMGIRPLTLSDLDAIVEIDRKVLGKPRQDFWKKRMELISATRYPHSCLVAELEGKVIGFILGWINTIGVDPAYQHRGVAKRLGEEFIKNVKAIGVSLVYTLVSWNDWDLLKFFRAMGFARGGDMINLELKID
jgi:ribosomal protein S18 acetylase RimI-like enzyme